MTRRPVKLVTFSPGSVPFLKTGKKGIVAGTGDPCPGGISRATLAKDDVAGFARRSPKNLDAETLEIESRPRSVEPPAFLYVP